MACFAQILPRALAGFPYQRNHIVHFHGNFLQLLGMVNIPAQRKKFCYDKIGGVTDNRNCAYANHAAAAVTTQTKYFRDCKESSKAIHRIVCQN